jgi:hypothetical protein
MMEFEGMVPVSGNWRAAYTDEGHTGEYILMNVVAWVCQCDGEGQLRYFGLVCGKGDAVFEAELPEGLEFLGYIPPQSGDELYRSEARPMAEVKEKSS